MCKIMMASGIKPSKQDKAWDWFYASLEFMTEADKDGVGYMATDGQNIFGERWVNPEESFIHNGPYGRPELMLKSMLGDAVDIQPTYNSFGNKLTGPTRAIALHTRMATTPKGLRNCHPFMSPEADVALIHNGVISNAKKLRNITSTCDSECILNEYVDSDVWADPNNIQSVADNLNGYYACAVLAKVKDTVFMDIFKDEGADLNVAWVKELGCYVYCTSRNILINTALKAGMTLGAIATVAPGRLIRLNVYKGRAKSVTEFDTGTKHSNVRQIGNDYPPRSLQWPGPVGSDDWKNIHHSIKDELEDEDSEIDEKELADSLAWAMSQRNDEDGELSPEEEATYKEFIASYGEKLRGR